jgi:MscS family membrane protein
MYPGMKLFSKLIIAQFTICFLFLLTSPVFGQKSASDFDPALNTPQQAVHTFLYWQNDAHENLRKSAITVQPDTALSWKEAETRAEKLLQIFDARGLIIDYNQISSNPNFTDTLTGTHQYVLFSQLPEIYLERYNGQWFFSKASVKLIPELYREHFSLSTEIILQKIPDSFQRSFLGLALWQYGAIFLWILLGLIIKRLSEYAIDSYFKRLTQKSKTEWDDAVVISAEKPLSFAFMTLFFLLTYANLHLSVLVNKVLSVTFEILFSISALWLLYNLINVLADYLQSLTAKTESKLDDQLVPLLRKSMKVALVLIGVIFILQNNGINVASLLAGLGLGGLAFALAARDTVANLFGSVTIFLDKPFQIGDWIKTGNIEGTVEEVGFRSTRVRTFYNSLVSVPNSVMANTDIDNLGLRQYRRLFFTLSMHYKTPPEQLQAFVDGIKTIISQTPTMRQDYYEVHFSSFGAHSLDVMVYCFFSVPTWSVELSEKHAFLMKILNFADELGVEFAYPTQSLYIDGNLDNQRAIGEAKSDEEIAAVLNSFGVKG